jgi:NDP-sugar pyrophosphorylase family protein
MKKYTLTKYSIVVNGQTLYRIKALKSFRGINTGQLGGFVQSDNNLSHKGLCWVYDNSKVYNNAKILGDSYITGNAQIYDNARIKGNSWVDDDAQVFGNAVISGNVYVKNNAQISGDCKLLTKGRIVDNKMWIMNDVQLDFGQWVNTSFYSQAELIKNAKFKMYYLMKAIKELK